jgi:N-terminal conserved domain of Nudc./CS domain
MMQQHAQPQFAKMQMDPRQLEALEAPLIALTKQCGGDLRNVLYAFFHFLHRRTDFYLVPHDDDLKQGKATMGFREGDAEKLLLVAFRQFPLRRIPPTSQQQLQQRLSQSQPSTTTAPSNMGKATMETATKETAKSSKGAAAVLDSQNGGGTKKEDAADAGDAATAVVPNKTTHAHKNPDEKLADMSSIRLTDDGLQIPIGNGGSTKRYKWTQTLEECSVLVGIPAGVKGKDLDVTLKKSFISVRFKKQSIVNSSSGDSGVKSSSASKQVGEQQDDGVFLEGNLSDGQEIVPSESTWSLEGGVLVLVLYKHQKTFWATVLDGDDKIDTSMVDSRRHIGDYDESTQAQIRKIMFDQSQASKGLPTSDQIAGTRLEVPLPTSQQRKLPPGVEYIDQSTIDQYTKDKKHKEKKKAGGA